MKGYVKIYLFYSAIFLIGASLSAGLYFAYGIRVFPTKALECGTDFSFFALTEVTAMLLKPLAVTFLGAFTIYSCFISSAACLYLGTVMGRLTIRYVLSDHNPFTHGAVLIFIAVTGAVFMFVSKEASLCRTYMRHTCPEPREIIRTDAASALIKSFAESVLLLYILSIAIYLILIYFPL